MSLKADVTKTEALAGDCEKLRQALEQAEEARRDQVKEGRREHALLERQLLATGRDRDQFAEQVLTVNCAFESFGGRGFNVKLIISC